MKACETGAFCLKDFNKNVEETWKELQFENDFSDMVLACEGQLFKAHKVVISSSSPVLRNILKNSYQNPFIYLTGVKSEDLRNIITLIYQGEVNVAEKNLYLFLEVAENLEIEGFCKISKDLVNVQENLTKKFIESGINTSQNYPVSYDYFQVSNTSIKEEVIKKDDQGTIKCPIEKVNYLENKNTEIFSRSETSHHHTLSFSENYLEKGSLEYISLNNDKVFTKTGSERKEINKKNTRKRRFLTKELKEYSDSLIASEDNLFSCRLCNKIFRDNYAAKKHTRTVHIKIHPCDQCDYKSTNLSQLKVHVDSIHEGIRHDCNQCNHKAKTKGGLIIHLNSKHKGVSYPCDLCDFKSTVKKSLDRHKASIHKTGEELLCEKCDYRTRTKENLRSHVRVKHQLIGVLCDKCNKLFSSNDHLKRHIESVHNKVRFLCNLCEHQTTQKGDLARHMRKVHTQ